MDIEFNSLQELYNRLKPVLFSKTEDLRRQGFSYIKEEDVWNYFREVKWEVAKDLNLYQMVSDILNTDNVLIDNYLKNKLNSRSRKIYFEEVHDEKE